MQTSLDPTQWKEDADQEAERWKLGPGSSSDERRRLYPLSCRIVKGSSTYGVKVGTTFRWVRTRLIPAHYPIEVLNFTPSGTRTFYCFAPDEAEILPPYEDA